MKIDRTYLQKLAVDTGFREEVLEKVLRLMSLLKAIRTHPFLKDKFALKGGAALNAFVFRMPRLSGDLDFNYVGHADVEKAKADRPKLEKAFKSVCEREDLRVEKIPDSHLGGTWRLRYDSVLGGESNLEVDINFGYRVPFWNPQIKKSFELGDYGMAEIPVLDIHELAAGKLVALVDRCAARDVFDVWKLFREQSLEDEKIRVGFVAYGAMSRRDWRGISADLVELGERTLKNELLPYLRTSAEDDFTVEDCAEMVAYARGVVAGLLPYSNDEREFLDRILDEGTIQPELLTDDDELRSRIGEHPLLKWKALNVRKHKS